MGGVDWYEAAAYCNGLSKKSFRVGLNYSAQLQLRKWTRLGQSPLGRLSHTQMHYSHRDKLRPIFFDYTACPVRERAVGFPS
jgi:hypothetical protein